MSDIPKLPREPVPEEHGGPAAAVRDVVLTTVALATLARFIPGKFGKLFATYVAGVEKTETGGVKPTKTTLFNFAPAPFGFMHPEAYGLPKNYYLPSGVTNNLPPVVDRIGLGLPEQRRADVAERERELTGVNLAHLKGAVALVENETDETLRDIVAGRGGLSRAGVIFATSGLGAAHLEIAARGELARREFAARNPIKFQGVGKLLGAPAVIKPLRAPQRNDGQPSSAVKLQATNPADP